MTTSRPSFLLLLLATALTAMVSTGCVAGKIAATPLTVVRDTVDAPLVTFTNVFELWADRTDPFAPPTPGVGWSWNGGFTLGIGYSIGYFVFKPLSGIFGGVDYLVCRSLYPNWPAGLNPWKKPGQSWGSLYFPNTRALWGDNPPDTVDDAPPADPSPAGAPASPEPASTSTRKPKYRSRASGGQKLRAADRHMNSSR